MYKNSLFCNIIKFWCLSDPSSVTDSLWLHSMRGSGGGAATCTWTLSARQVSADSSTNILNQTTSSHTEYVTLRLVAACSVVWNTECSPERGPEWAGMRLRRVWWESAQERPLKPGVLRPGSALLARERGLSGRALPVCWIGVCIGIVYWSCVRRGFACLDPSCVCGERYQRNCVCDGAVCADVRCVCSSIWAYKGRMAMVSGVHCW